MNQNFEPVSRLLNSHPLYTSLFTLAIVGGFDYVAGPQIATAIFYLIPVGFVAHHAKTYTFVAISFLTAGVWGLNDLASGIAYTSTAIPAWNFIMRFGLFLFVGNLIYRQHKKSAFYQKLAEIDELTGLLNRRGFLIRVEEELTRARRFERQYSIAYIDLDNFKQVNDNYGHQAGDELLCLVSNTLTTYLRATDHVARVGGDEFTVLLVETDQEAAKFAFEKCYQALNQKLLVNGMGVTASVGVVTYSNFSTSLSDMLKKADSWMYHVKKNGKNRVEYRYDTDESG